MKNFFLFLVLIIPGDFIFAQLSDEEFKNILKNKDTIEVDLSGWMKHVICNNFSIENRFTDYYPDFLGTDTYAFMLEFDQSVSIAKSPENIDINNDFGNFNFTVKQMGENKILINSYFLIKSLFVRKENIEHVALIYNAIENNNTTNFKVNKCEGIGKHISSNFSTFAHKIIK